MRTQALHLQLVAMLDWKTKGDWKWRNAERICTRFSKWFETSKHDTTIFSISEPGSSQTSPLFKGDDVWISRSNATQGSRLHNMPGTAEYAHLPHVHDADDPRFTMMCSAIQSIIESEFVAVIIRQSNTCSLVQKAYSTIYAPRLGDFEIWEHSPMASDVLVEVRY